ncbi:MAG TPA: acyltransferase [Caulobacteraceae bacterium]|nr:acyltransferase [Caulobacteraceae bacterium]
MKPLLSIQYLRAFAALAVVVFHACQWMDIDFDIGAGGVDVFFIISGFLMWKITDTPGAMPGAFLWKRVTRVVPLYWIATLGVVALALAAPWIVPKVKPEPAHVLLSMLFIPHLDPAGIPFPLLPPGWTLNYEAILYLIFTAALSLPRAWRFRLVIGALFSITITGLFAYRLFPLFANPMMLEFAAGVVMARAYGARAYGDGPRLGVGTGWSLVALGVVTFAMLKALGLHSDIGRWVLWGAPAVMMVTGALAVEAAGRLPRSAPLKRLGDASYAIYLCHWPLLALIAKLIGKGPPWLFIPAATIAATALGLAVHYAVERPAIRLLRRRRTDREAASPQG